MSTPAHKPGYYRHSIKRRSYRKVLLAVYWLADAKGLICIASNKQIAKAAGVGYETARSFLSDMESDGTVAIFDDRGLPFRVIVLMDHPEAPRLVHKGDEAARIRDRWKREERLYHTFYDEMVAADEHGQLGFE